MTLTDQRTEGTNAIRGLFTLFGLALVTIGLVQTWVVAHPSMGGSLLMVLGAGLLVLLWVRGPR